MKNQAKAEKKFQKVMHEFGQGELKSHDKPVTNQKQAVAIAFSEARKVYPNYGMKKGGGVDKPLAVKGIFSLDAYEDKQYPGYTFGEDWNGWATPYFEKDVSDRIMKDMDGKYENGKYLFDEGYDDEDPEEFKKETIDTVDGTKEVFPIGSYYWTWNNDIMHNGGGITKAHALELSKIYTTGTAKQLWEAWTKPNRVHFLLDHATEFFELMGDDFNQSSEEFSELSYDALPDTIRRSIVIHHAQGMYNNGGSITTQMHNGGVIGDKRANEIVKYAIEIAKKEGIELPKMEAFLKKGPEPGVILEAYEEFKYNFNNGNNKKSLRFAYEDSNRFTNYVMSFLPNSVQRKMYKHYGDAPIKKNFPYYQEGGGVNLFEDYENIPPKVNRILKKYPKVFQDGDSDYNVLKKALNELEKIGYTFEYGLDGSPYDLRKIGEKGKSEDSLMKDGGHVRMYNFLKEDLEKLEKAISEGDKEEVERFFSYWGQHLDSLKTKNQ